MQPKLNLILTTNIYPTFTRLRLDLKNLHRRGS